jgi:hypothetical protein
MSRVEKVAIGIAALATVLLTTMPWVSQPDVTKKTDTVQTAPVKPSQAAGISLQQARRSADQAISAPTGFDPSGSVDERNADEERMDARREEIRDYFADRRAKLNIVANTRTSSGQEFDWIPREAFDADGQAVTPPPMPDADTDQLLSDGYSPEHDDYNALTELQQEPEAWGPEGTVPVVRMDTDEYVASLRPQGTLQDFLSKYGRQDLSGAPAPTSPVPGLFHPERGYAFTRHIEPNIGSKGSINIWQPYVGNSAEFSLGQTAIAAQTEDSRVCLFRWYCRSYPSVLQTIEAGWQKAPPGTSINGDWYTHFFIYFNTNGYASQGDKIGGYNTTVEGFVQHSSTVTPGARLTSISRLGSSQYSATIDVRLWQGNWWIRYGNEWVGYYPASLFGNFRVGGLEQGADRVTWYGEVVDLPDDGMPTNTDMGSGRFPDQGFRYSAYMRNLLIRRQNGTLTRFDPDNMGTTGADVGCYELDTHFSSTGSWQSYFYWGGPGRSSTC